MDPDTPFTPLETGALEPLTVAETRERQPKLPPGEWVKKNLFNNWYNSAITVILGLAIIVSGYLILRFVFVTARWAPVIENLTLFLVGRFPRSAADNQLWRVVAQVIIWSGAMGLAWGASVSGAKFRAMQAGVEYTEDKVLARIRRYWSLIALVVLLLVIAKTFGPVLVVLAALGVGVGLQMIGARIPGQHAGVTWAGVAFLGVLGYQIVSGFVGTGWHLALVVRNHTENPLDARCGLQHVRPDALGIVSPATERLHLRQSERWPPHDLIAQHRAGELRPAQENTDGVFASGRPGKGHPRGHIDADDEGHVASTQGGR